MKSERIYEIRSHETRVKANGREVYIKGYMPAEQGRFPTIIMSHGYNGCHKDFERECRYYAQNGFVAYALDFCGGSTRSLSSGKSTEMTLFTEKEDLLAVFAYVKEMENVDTGNIFLFGGSQGGLVTTMAIEEVAEQVKGMALYYPALHIPDNWRTNFATVDEIPEVVDFWGLQLGKVFFTAMREYRTFDHIGGYGRNVLIIHGDKDEIVAKSVAEQAILKYAHARLVILPGEGHGFTPEGGHIAMEQVLAFMQNEAAA